MAASVAFSKQDQQSRSRPIRKYIYTWVSHTDGAVAAATAIPNNAYVSGELVSIQTVPNAGGTAPTTLYDVTVLNEQGVDIMMGLGADRSATLPEVVFPVAFVTDGETTPITGVRSIFLDDKLRIVVAAAGSGKGGKVVVTVR